MLPELCQLRIPMAEISGLRLLVIGKPPLNGKYCKKRLKAALQTIYAMLNMIPQYAAQGLTDSELRRITCALEVAGSTVGS